MTQTELNHSNHLTVATDDKVASTPLINSLGKYGYLPEVLSFEDVAKFLSEDTITLLVDIHTQSGLQQFIKQVKLPVGDDLSVMVLCSSVTSRQRLQIMRLGIKWCLPKPVSDQQLISALALANQVRMYEPVKILLVGDTQVADNHVMASFSSKEFEISQETDPLQTIDKLNDIGPHAVLVAGDCLAEISALEFVQLVRSVDAFLSTPIIFIAHNSQFNDQFNQQVATRALHPVHCLSEPVNPGFMAGLLLNSVQQQREQSIARDHQKTALNQQEQRHQCIDRHAHVMITDAKGCITYVNDQLCQLSGYERKELLGQTANIFKSGQHPQTVYVELWKTVLNGKVWQGTLCNRAKNGQLHWMNVTISPVFDVFGSINHHIAMLTDVTSMKMHQVALETLVDSLAAPDTDTKTLLNKITKAVAQIFEMDIAFISQRQSGDMSRCATLAFWDTNQWLDNFEYEVKGTPCARVGPGEAACFSNHAAELFPNFSWLHDHGIESYFAVPLESVDGRLHGQLGIMHRQPLTKTYPLEHVLKIYAKQISLELDRRQAIDALRHSEKKYRTLTSRIPGMVYTADTDWQVVQLAEKRSFFGHPREKLQTSDSPWLKLIHPGDKANVIEISKKMAGLGEDIFHEYRIQDGDGKWRWVSDHKHPRYNEQGEFVGVEGIVLDVTDHKQAAIQLAKRENQLVVAQKIAHMGSWSLDIATGHLDWSKEAFRLLGYEPDSIEPTLDAFSTHVHKDDLKNQTLHHLLDWNTTQPTREAEYRVHCSDDDYRYVHELTMAEFSHTGRLTKLYGAIQDISEKRKAEVALRLAFNEAEYANKAKSEFLACMSHELRTPMNSILGFSQLMEHDEALTEDHQESIHEINKAGKHLLRLINDVLDLSKVEAGKLTVSLEPVSSYPVITECLSLMAHSAKKRHIQISRTDQQDMVIRADQVRLRQALLNLLSNAIKYNSEHGDVRIFTSRQPNSNLRITIEDSGTGIPYESQSQVFTPFTRFAADEAKTRGTGIGLAITKRIIELMEGSIGFESTPGQGSKFWLELKRENVRKIHRSSSEAADAPHFSPLSDTKNNHQILYIEDNPANMRLVELILSRRKAVDLICAPTPELGIEMAENNDPALILLDINLPRMDGYEVFNRLKSIPAMRSVPVIAVTANALLKDVEKGRRAGFSAYLTKPLNVENFNATLDKFLSFGERHR